MQTLTVEIEDSFLKEFMNFTQKFTGKVKIYDPKKEDCYYADRQKELTQIREDIKNKKITMKSHDDVWGNVKNHLQNIS
ncbi:MAG: hypothetical protein OIF32_02925 [Campylobacterales bacterium]|nr:hypothetical protein [Campylobacterales bacterium]